jgi:hypothetical protein
LRDDNESPDRNRSASDAKTPAKASAKSPASSPERRFRKRAPTGEVGSALRSVYDDTLREDIPPEMLDLLGKLG